MPIFVIFPLQQQQLEILENLVLKNWQMNWKNGFEDERVRRRWEMSIVGALAACLPTALVLTQLWIQLRLHLYTFDFTIICAFVEMALSILTLFPMQIVCFATTFTTAYIQGGFFNWSARFSVPKWKNLLSQQGAFLHWKFREKLVLVGCHLFFILVLKIGRTS